MFERNGYRILIVEDDLAILDLLVTRLELAGYRTNVARNGKIALQFLRDQTPDAIILDLNMPEIDGFSVLMALRRRPERQRPPTLVLTARNAADDVRKCLELGAKDYLSKPFNDKLLLARVARLLRPRAAAPAAPAAPVAPRGFSAARREVVDPNEIVL